MCHAKNLVFIAKALEEAMERFQQVGGLIRLTIWKDYQGWRERGSRETVVSPDKNINSDKK